MIKQLTVDDLVKLIEQENPYVIDIRDLNSYSNGHIADSIRIDNDNFQSFVENADKSRPIVVCCYHGHSSQQVTALVQSLGFVGYSLIGGMSKWSNSQPVIKD